MRSKHTFRPQIEGLEARWVPATIRLVAGNLFVSNPAGELTVESTAVNGQFKVTDGAKAVLVNGVGSLIAITGNNLANKINFLANTASGNQAFNGNLLIRAGNGNDLVNLSGRVGGNVTLLTGLGNDTVTSLSNDVSIGGNLTMADGLGLNVVDLNDRNYTIGGNATLFGVGPFDSGTGNTLSVGGSMTMTATVAAANPMTVLLGSLETQIGGMLSINGSTLADVVNVTSKLSLGGNFWLNLGNGDNTFVLTPTAGGTGVNGSLSYLGGGGIDVAVFGADSSISGNTSLDFGEGINTFVDTATSLYAGNLTLVGGNGTNTQVVTGIIAGNLSITNGNGDGNTSVITATLGGQFRYRLGNGTLGTLTLAPAVPQSIIIDALFGTGDSTFTLGPNLTLSGIVRGTGGVYTFNQGTAVLAPTLQLIDYP